MNPLTRRELEDILQGHSGVEALRAAIEKTSSDKIAAVETMAAIVQFNAVFAGCVARLAGSIRDRPDLFREKAEEGSIIGDRSYVIADDIFYAAIDEFGPVSHRALAQQTLQECCSFAGIKADGLFETEQLYDTLDNVRRGYSAGREEPSSLSLLRSIGFHIGSELLADQEFSVLDIALRNAHPALVAQLEERKAYAWIRLHTSVEAVHRDRAIKAANNTMQYNLVKGGTPEHTRDLILEGYAQFASLQEKFMRNIEGMIVLR